MTHLLWPREWAYRFSARHVALEVHLAHMKQNALVSHKTYVLVYNIGVQSTLAIINLRQLNRLSNVALSLWGFI